MKTSGYWMIALFLMPAPACAQQWFNNTLQIHTNNVRADGFRVSVVTSANDAVRRGSARKSQADKAVAAKPVKTRYTPSLARRKANMAQFVARTRSVDPAGADQMQAQFASSDLIAEIGKVMPRWGLRSDDFADAYALYWTTAWLGSRGSNDDPPRSQILAVREQIVDALRGDAQFAAANDAMKQELAEAMLIHAMMISQAVNHGISKQPDRLPEIKNAVDAGARSMGIDLWSMTLTPTGFQGITSGEARDVVPEATSPRAFVERAPVETGKAGESSAGGSYALAALGGAGLIGVFMLGRISDKRAA